MNRPLILQALFMAAALTAGAQVQQTTPNLPVDPDTKKIQYRDVIEQEGSKDILYDRAMLWFNYYYVNPISVFNIQDKVNGKIDGTGRLKIYYKDPTSGVRTEGGLIQYNIRLEFKENKYRYTLTDFILKANSRLPVEKWLNKQDPAYNVLWDAYLYQIDTTMQRLISTLKTEMKPKVIKKDEW